MVRWVAFVSCFFSVLAIKIKVNAASAHTFPDIVLSRYGYIAHITYLFFGLATNLLVGA
jgi:Na+/proline symporter